MKIITSWLSLIVIIFLVVLGYLTLFSIEDAPVGVQLFASLFFILLIATSYFRAFMQENNEIIKVRKRKKRLI